LKPDINLVPRHTLASRVSEDVSRIFKFARVGIFDGLVEGETISMRNTITKVSNHFSFGGVTEVSI
jgi:hypothetical protein